VVRPYSKPRAKALEPPVASIEPFKVTDVDVTFVEPVDDTLGVAAFAVSNIEIILSIVRNIMTLCL
jgi:hypothetical protein